MSKNRFEQVDEPQDDAITLSFARQEDGDFGFVRYPAVLTKGRLQEDVESGQLPVVEAFRSAIKLANEMKAPVVVRDPDGLWNAEWGTLYRPV
ncbi:MAG: hypothetical protein J0H62_01515 [Rhizobiales bacterium]|nr:hypothetical protein [Hyphomicrobiales bacterium]